MDYESNSLDNYESRFIPGLAEAIGGTVTGVVKGLNINSGKRLENKGKNAAMIMQEQIEAYKALTGQNDTPVVIPAAAEKTIPKNNNTTVIIIFVVVLVIVGIIFLKVKKK